jgi:cell division transport system ATP-binding protein
MADSINFINVSKRYDNGVHALKDVSFSVAEGEFVFVIGESGAGKSTIIKLLTREEKTTRGKILLNNFDVTALYEKHVPYMRRKIGMIFQDFRLIETKTVYENVAFAMEIIGASPRAIKRRVPIVLSLVGLKNRANMYPSQLSGGEAQRTGIARAVVNNPKIILADEPTGNLDPANSESIMAVLRQVNREGTTVLCCTHDLTSVRRMGQRVLEFSDGCLVSDTGGELCDTGIRVPSDEFTNMDLERILYRRQEMPPETVPDVVPASTIQADIERILSRLPRRARRASGAREASAALREEETESVGVGEIESDDAGEGDAQTKSVIDAEAIDSLSAAEAKYLSDENGQETVEMTDDGGLSFDDSTVEENGGGRYETK